MRYPLPALCEDAAYERLNAERFGDEARLRGALLAELDWPDEQRAAILARARGWVKKLRERPGSANLLDRFLAEHSLTSREGVALLCLAEAALRIPDEATLDALIRDKLVTADWRPAAGHDSAGSGQGSLFVNASTWALMLTGKVLSWHEDPERDLLGALRRRLEKSGEPLVRQALRAAMRILGEQFVMGRDIGAALERAGRGFDARCRHSFDMLGEAARTDAHARRYFDRYQAAISAVGEAAAGAGPVDGPGISIKLSALHPRCEYAQAERVTGELLPRLRELARQAAAADIGLTIDAEEASRHDLLLDLFAALCADPALAGWNGLGIAVQAYQPRALAVVDFLAELAARQRRRIMVRLVKGAYWDAEIKLAQQQGLPGYPVFTRKVNTDLCWLACAARLFAHDDRIYPQFATNNAHSIAAALALADGRPFELQRLHGMGEALHDLVLDETGTPCRAYDPVGSHADLLPYLVRRLLENGANSSFVHRLADASAPVETVVTDPIAVAREQDARGAGARHPRIPAPVDLFQPDRRNSRGLDLSDPAALGALATRVDQALAEQPGGIWQAEPMVVGGADPGESRRGRRSHAEPDGAAPPGGAAKTLHDPADVRREIGQVRDADGATLDRALDTARAAAPGWAHTPADARAACLERAADLLEAHLGNFVALCGREAGKSIPDGIAEVREAADFCRYYAARARERFGAPRELPGPVGEHNLLSLHGRGVFACISPWNFPLAIFTGQVTAALAAGNAVVAKPAEQTPLTAALGTRLLHEAGIPADVLQLLPGDGPGVGAPLAADPRIDGVAFTGSLDTARAINRALAERTGAIAPLIAETGGQNAMIVDASALPEQVVTDVLASAFQSSGQRCSALRVLCVQDDVAERLLDMLSGAMAELRIGDPLDLATDVGPVIDSDALAMLQAHAARMDREARLIHRCALPPRCEHGHFFAPRAYEIDGLERLQGEVFGPVLHVLRFQAQDLDGLIERINALGYGLTFGVHSRIDARIDAITGRIHAGNSYVNRNMIGAVVGVQPFGGEGLSGTGPKAGGPDYLTRFAVERTVSINTAASGGNAALLSMDEDDAGASR
ncbi:MAG: bifunctional proline dehydrogenase/L-glutamate gamma-semialdehyde dehydrogenase PutA [Thiohalocapsa sp.]|uniref:bifunctional proline dehydrogenase/L-glutamate gamma-semialdehyde dehydrogenase PutA n=1 Tax=Thiohalocapsa sp. TaxID=2497641 RepID=UPI0025E0290C|nr:bifunctional proline dehydrogenase/L-glutamate gamma-semialdehyde dehydrogenase PutA [Thiohalocapsa sp.]MCG6939918.1 bifunctional proline dehydrogenase/L-glutamate gamma-semialdehyde dehydrogenase PutA [Thiohalocapsa sp.]